MSRIWAWVLLSLRVAQAVQRPRAQLQARKIIGNLSTNLQASRHAASVSAGLSLEHQLGSFLCRGQKAPAKVLNDHKNLTFIHIPRCAGTSVEDCTAADEIRWGQLDHQLHGLYSITRGQRCYKQHVPPSELPELYTDKATFCVVRNPYERMISEFHFPLTQGFGARAKAGRCNKEGLNEFTIQALTSIKEREDPYLHDCHLLPQTSYVYGWDVKTSKVTRTRKPWCKHLIRQEHLKPDFNKLMQDYGYTYRLTDVANPSTVAGPSWNCTHVTPEDFGPEARAMIHEVWKDDFELLNFPMLPV